MTSPRSVEKRVLIYAPRGRDAELTQSILRKKDFDSLVCADVKDLCSEIRTGTGAVLTTAEALIAETTACLLDELSQQPPWSEIPILVFAPAEAVENTYERLGSHAHVTLLDRPIHVKTLLSVVDSALRSRLRQYEIRDLMDRLEERIQERDRFLAILGHELRNPLAAILLASQMPAQDGRLDSAHALVIERQSLHLTRLVNDLLDLSRVASGKIRLKPQLLDLVEVARHSLKTASESDDTHSFSLEIADDGPLLVQADAVRLDQIINNLLTNSIKYTPEGGSISVDLAREGNDAVIRVCDTGVGISPERIGNVFELFAQAENAIGRSQGGMGIGLSLVRNLVTLHGGSVSASSEGVGKGCEFVIRLPLSSNTEMKVVPQVEKSEAGAAPRRIVIVEDNADVRDLLRLKLKRLGHEVDAAPDGIEGIKTVVDKKPEVALIDIGLPGADGYEVAAKVREELGDSVVLIALSGFGQAEDKKKALEAGFDEHLTKPAEMSDIAAILSRFFEKDEPEELP